MDTLYVVEPLGHKSGFAKRHLSPLGIFSRIPRLIDETFSLAVYTAMLSDTQQLRFFFNSYLISEPVTVFTLIVGIVAGYSFSRYNFRFMRASCCKPTTDQVSVRMKVRSPIATPMSKP